MTQLDPDDGFIAIPDDLKEEMNRAAQVDDVNSVHTGYTTATGGTKVSRRLLESAQDENEAMRRKIEQLTEQVEKARMKGRSQQSGQHSD